MSGVVEVACVRVVGLGPGINFNRLKCADQDLIVQKELCIKNSDLKLLLPGIVVVHDTHVMVIGLVVHDQAGES